jgi:hypothetical protein
MTSHRTTHRVLICLLLAGCFLLPGCKPQSSPSSVPAVAGETNTLAASTQSLPGGLTLEEHALTSPPALEPLTFTPVEGTQAGILARHAALRADRLPVQLTTIDGLPAIRANELDRTLVAKVVITNNETQEMEVELLNPDRVVFTAPAGYPSPASPLQALWIYDGEWALEILFATPDEWKGQLYIGGQLVNEQNGYEEAVGSQLLDGKLLYFYQKDGTIGISYDGQDTPLGYSQLPHYQCCSGSALNPSQAREMVAFFAERNGVWYYTELGKFD